MEGRVYAFLAVGKGQTEKGDAARYVRIGRCQPESVWQRLHHGPSSAEEVLMNVPVPDVKEAVSKLVEILRGNAFYGPERHKLGGWHDELLYEKSAFGNYWFETVYSVSQLIEIFRNIGLELKPEVPAAAKAPTTGNV